MRVWPGECRQFPVWWEYVLGFRNDLWDRERFFILPRGTELRLVWKVKRVKSNVKAVEISYCLWKVGCFLKYQMKAQQYFVRPFFRQDEESNQCEKPPAHPKGSHVLRWLIHVSDWELVLPEPLLNSLRQNNPEIVNLKSTGTRSISIFRSQLLITPVKNLFPFETHNSRLFYEAVRMTKLLKGARNVSDHTINIKRDTGQLETSRSEAVTTLWCVHAHSAAVLLLKPQISSSSVVGVTYGANIFHPQGYKKNKDIQVNHG